MIVTARRATAADVDHLVEMYDRLVDEQRAIRPIWPYADGLGPPVENAIASLLEDQAAVVIVGEIDGAPLGLLAAVEEALLPPMDDRRIGVIKLIYTEHDARGVGVGAAMLAAALDHLTGRGVEFFDAPVSPGHRMAKNFFESKGFKARSIVMHRSDGNLDDAGER